MITNGEEKDMAPFFFSVTWINILNYLWCILQRESEDLAQPLSFGPMDEPPEPIDVPTEFPYNVLFEGYAKVSNGKQVIGLAHFKYKHSFVWF